MNTWFTLEGLIADHNPAESKIFFSNIRYNYLNKNYTLGMEVLKEENYAEIEFFDWDTVENAIKAYYTWLNTEIDIQKNRISEIEEEQNDSEIKHIYF